MSDQQQSSPEALLRRLEWTVLRRLDGLLQGDYRTLWRGAGLDLADLREYQHGDDVRHIDWNVTARLQQPHVRQFTEDRELTAWFLLDLTGSVDFGSNDRTKLAVSEGFVAVLARLLTRHGNRVGALLYGQHGPQRPIALLPAGVGRRHVLGLIASMRQRPAPQAGRGTVLADLLRAGETIIKRRSLVFVVSDFISAPGWEDALGRLARRHEVLAVRLYDPLELKLPDVGLVTIEDAESGEQVLVDTQEPGFRERFEKLAAGHEDALRQSLARAGVDALELATDDDLMAALLRFVALRRQRLRAPAGHRMPASLRHAATSVAP
ncbi:DUF58 domain-containing protein [Aquabacterium humicola]|uniref:DUF58 domain-containing protein n=1 Tax=Aquabacterium humicola TaxID=3237377 RepID=UPI002542BEDA|nr:DUF58 domain-containing protein [Rubrivivax pictus]